MKHAFIAVMAFLAGLTAGAQTYTYLGGNSDAGIFASVNGSGASADLSAYWQDGLVPFDSVTNAELGVGADIVLGGATLAQYKNYRMASVSTGGGSSPWNKANWYFKAITGPWNLRLEFPNVDYSYSSGRTFQIEDPSGFQGLWWHAARSHKGPYRQSLLVTSSDPDKAVIHRVLAEGRMGFGAPAGQTLTLENPMGMGAFHVNAESGAAAGTVEILNSPGGRSNPTVFRGKLVLHGNPDPEAGIPEGAWLHLDANVAGSLTVEDGKVTEWRDARGNGIRGTKHSWALGDPTLTTDSVSGLKVVNFGAFTGSTAGTEPSADDVAAFGQPSGLSFSSICRDVKEMFIVFRDNQSAKASPAFAGVTDSYAGVPGGYVNRFIRNDTYGRLFLDDTLVLPTGYDERSAQAMPLHAGEIRFDGQRVRPAYADDFTSRMHVLSVGLPAGVVSDVGTLSASRDPLWRFHIGGNRIGELLLYTNSLTSVQRRQVNAYLRRKWQKGEADWDLGFVELAGADAAVEVADGTARIRELAVPAGTTELVKTGAGTLVLDRLVVGGVAARIPVRVREGAFRYGDGFGEISETKAADPDVWFDASQIAAGDTTTIGSKDYVTVWRDPRGTNPKGVAITAERHPKNGVYAAYATILRGELNGKDVVSFGQTSNLPTYDWTQSGKDTAPYDICRNGSADPATMPNYDTSPSCRVREGFMVCRVPGSASAIWATSVADNLDFYNGGNSRKMYLIGYGNSQVDGAYWQMNGLPFSARTEATIPVNAFVVISFAAAETVPVNAFAMDRGNSGNYGGIDVAECLLYDRLLTPAERRNTTAYLMRKWLGQDHPDAAVAGTVAEVTTPDGIELTTEGDGTLEKVSSPAGTLVKRGEGTLEVGDAMNFLDFSGFSVEEGSVSVGIGASNVMARAYFHVDAEASDMTITNAVPGGDDYVTVWNDVRNNGRAAYAYNDKNLGGGRSPILSTETIAGRARKVVAFGPQYAPQNAPSAKIGAMRWFSPSAGDAAQKKTYAELWILHADDSNTRGYLFGMPNYVANPGTIDGEQVSSTYPFYRTADQIIDSSAKLSAATLRGEVYVDDVRTNGFYKLTQRADYHLFSMVPAYPVVAGGFAQRESYEYGGSRTAEAMVFEATNSVAERAMVRALLMKKWFGTGTAYSPSFESLDVAKGASFTVASDPGVGDWNVAALSGGGTIDVGHGIGGVETIGVKFNSATDYDCLTIGGPLTLASGATVTVTMPAGSAKTAGRFRIVAADSVTGTANLVVENLPRNVTATLETDKDGLYLRMERGGLLLLMR